MSVLGSGSKPQESNEGNDTKVPHFCVIAWLGAQITRRPNLCDCRTLWPNVCGASRHTSLVQSVSSFGIASHQSQSRNVFAPSKSFWQRFLSENHFDFGIVRATMSNQKLFRLWNRSRNDVKAKDISTLVSPCQRFQTENHFGFGTVLATMSKRKPFRLWNPQRIQKSRFLRILRFA